jgi:hypothetical protein
LPAQMDYPCGQHIEGSTGREQLFRTNSHSAEVVPSDHRRPLAGQ